MTETQVLAAVQDKFQRESSSTQRQLLDSWRDAARNPRAYMPSFEDYVQAAIREAQARAVGEVAEYAFGDEEIGDVARNIFGLALEAFQELVYS